MPTIARRRVTKRYPGATTSAVDGFDLTIDHGDFMCMLGPSGCGKTTTLRMIAGLDQPTAGSISVDDQVLDSVDRGVFVPPERREMGLVFQSYALWPHMTIRQNIEYGLRLRKVARAERGRRADEVMAVMSIDRYADRYPSVGRTTAAGGAGPDARRQPRRHASRRTALEPRLTAAPRDAGITQAHPPRLRLHHRLRDPRPVGGNDIGDADHGDVRGPSPTDRVTDRHLRPTREPPGRRVPRQPAHQRRRDRRCRVRTTRGGSLRIRQGADAGHRRIPMPPSSTSTTC